MEKEGAILEAWDDRRPTNGEARMLSESLFQLQAGDYESPHQGQHQTKYRQQQLPT